VVGDLNDNVRGGSKPEKPQGLALLDSGKPQVAVSDRAGAEKRSRLPIGESFRDRIAEIFRDHRVLGIPSVCVTSRSFELGAQVFVAFRAKTTGSTCRMDPRDSHAISNPEPGRPVAQALHVSNNLVTQNDG